MTPDEKRIKEIEARVLASAKDGGASYSIGHDDWQTLMASWLAWKMTAKSFAATVKDFDDANEAMGRL